MILASGVWFSGLLECHTLVKLQTTALWLLSLAVTSSIEPYWGMEKVSTTSHHVLPPAPSFSVVHICSTDYPINWFKKTNRKAPVIVQIQPGTHLYSSTVALAWTPIRSSGSGSWGG